MVPSPRTDLFVTTAFQPSPAMREQVRRVAAELNAPVVARQNFSLPKLFAAHPDAARALVVQSQRLLLASRDGHEFFYHPNMAYLRLGALMDGGHDFFLEAAQIGPGDLVLDATLGFASEAILCAHVVGATGEVHGIEAVPELGVVVREGLQTVVTARDALNAAMRRVRVVHIGHHLEYLRTCSDKRYDVVCFDPFFEESPTRSETFDALRAFGDHARLSVEAVTEAKRIARRRVVIKASRRSDMLHDLGITEFHASRVGKVVYGVLPADGVILPAH